MALAVPPPQLLVSVGAAVGVGALAAVLEANAAALEVAPTLILLDAVVLAMLYVVLVVPPLLLVAAGAVVGVVKLVEIVLAVADWMPVAVAVPLLVMLLPAVPLTTAVAVLAALNVKGTGPMAVADGVAIARLMEPLGVLVTAAALQELTGVKVAGALPDIAPVGLPGPEGNAVALKVPPAPLGEKTALTLTKGETVPAASEIEAAGLLVLAEDGRDVAVAEKVGGATLTKMRPDQTKVFASVVDVILTL